MGHWDDGDSRADRSGRNHAQGAQGKADDDQRNPFALARKHRVDIGCPITTGIFAWIAANAAEEAAAEGTKRITPYLADIENGWRVEPEVSGRGARLRKLLASEGHRVVQKGKRFFVADYEKAVINSFA
jgi:hypothetical protein